MHGILITGAAHGIGAGLAAEFAASGHPRLRHRLEARRSRARGSANPRCGWYRRSLGAERDFERERRGR